MHEYLPHFVTACNTRASATLGELFGEPLMKN